MPNITRLLATREFLLEPGVEIGLFLLKSLRRSLRICHFFEDEEKTRYFLDGERRAILCFWHGRLLMMPFSIQTKEAAIMISQDNEGDFVSRFMERYGYESIRGSASRGSLSAMKKMLACHRRGKHLGITPDGPSGPQHQVKSGVLELAKLTGTPILPLTFGAYPRRVLHSWDEFVIPFPFATCVFFWGEPLWVSRVSGKERMGEAQRVLQERMEKITMKADECSRELFWKRRSARNRVEADLIPQRWGKASK